MPLRGAAEKAIGEGLGFRVQVLGFSGVGLGG